MSLRLRLTLLYSVILALTLMVLGTLLYFALAGGLRAQLQAKLVADTQQILASKEFQLHNIDWQSRAFAAADLYAQTCTADGQPIAQTDNLQAVNVRLPLDNEKLAAIKRGLSLFKVEEINNTRMLVYGTPVKNNGRLEGILLVARSLDQQEQTLNLLRTALVLGGSVVTLSAFGVGWVLSGTALRPINRITRTAHAIGSERDFGRRVDYNGPGDEVGRLATTFNTMLTELQAAYAQVEHALQAQRRFVADASHELRTPLTTIRGNLGLLQRQPPIDPADRDAVLADMVDETERMGRLVNDLLTLARTDAGRTLRNESVPLKPLIDEMCRTAHALSTTHTMVCANDLNVTARGDEDALKQVVLILLDNALRYTPAGGTVTLATGTTGEYVTISGRDTGPGIASDLLPHIFERFRRGDVTRSGTGTGLGLSIAKALVEAQGGTIAVESSEGRGSVFVVTLPRANG